MQIGEKSIVGAPDFLQIPSRQLATPQITIFALPLSCQEDLTSYNSNRLQTKRRTHCDLCEHFAEIVQQSEHEGHNNVVTNGFTDAHAQQRVKGIEA